MREGTELECFRAVAAARQKWEAREERALIQQQLLETAQLSPCVRLTEGDASYPAELVPQLQFQTYQHPLGVKIIHHPLHFSIRSSAAARLRVCSQTYRRRWEPSERLQAPRFISKPGSLKPVEPRLPLLEWS